MSTYFGTDGFRGEAGITLTADHAYKVCRFLGWYYNALRERNGDTDPAVQEAVPKVAEALGDTGRILVRESGTEPVVRVMVEAPDHDICQKYVSQVVEVIKNKGYAV